MYLVVWFPQISGPQGEKRLDFRYSDWALEPIKNSLFALSSGSWTNQDVVVEEGFIPLDVALVLEHGADAKIAEESLQVVKALTFYSDEFRHKVSDAGMFKAMAQVLASRSFDRGAVSLVCETLPFLVGPAFQVSTYPETVRQIPFDADIQARAGKDGMLEALLARAMSAEEMQHFEHGGFNFNVDAAYPAQQHCYQALQSMAQ
ncbi:NRT2.5, partial [Symbiodinium sp. CCMP2456]